MIDYFRMSVSDFLVCCQKRGWHFTVMWINRRIKDMQKEEK